MSLKQRIRIAIIGLVLAIVMGATILGVHGVLEHSFELHEQRSALVAEQIYSYVQGRFAVDERTTASVSPNLLRRDQVLQRVMDRTVNRFVTGLALVDKNGRLIASSGNWSEDLDLWPADALWLKFARVMRSNEDALEMHSLAGSGDLNVRTRLSMPEVKKTLTPQLSRLLLISFGALLLTSSLAVLLSNVVSRSIERLSRDVERFSADESGESEPFFESPELADLQMKLKKLASQYHGARTHADHLRLDIDTMLQRLEEVVLVFDAGNYLEMAGRPAERLFLKPREELIQKPIGEILPSWTELGSVVLQAVRTRVALVDRPVTFDRPNMLPVKLLATVEPMQDKEGRARGCLVTLRDAEMRRALQSEIDISSRLASISRLTSGVAHEMKNPLNGMALHLELLKSSMTGDAAPQQIEVIEKELNRLDRVVKTFLEFSRPINLNLGECDLRALAREAVADALPAANTRRIVLDVTPTADPAPVLADAELCFRAIRNVLANALEAMSKPGRIEVGVDQVFDDFVLTVKDEGDGIAPENQDKVYNLYFTTKPDASGAGLALTYLVIQLHNAKIDFDSEPGQGTEFRLRFPALKAAA